MRLPIAHHPEGFNLCSRSSWRGAGGKLNVSWSIPRVLRIQCPTFRSPEAQYLALDVLAVVGDGARGVERGRTGGLLPVVLSPRLHQHQPESDGERQRDNNIHHRRRHLAWHRSHVPRR